MEKNYSHKKCCCPCHKHEEVCEESCEASCPDEEKHEGYMEYFLEAADCAWMEVLKDKMKEHILSTQGDRLAELAKIVSEGNSQRWKFKMEKKHACKDFAERLCQFFGKFKK
jgi:hypothetical protein